MKKSVTERVFECPCCKTKHIAYKKTNRLTPKGHIKTMYCWKCKETRDLVQLTRYY